MIEREEISRAKKFIELIKTATPETKAAVMEILTAPDEGTVKRVVTEYKEKLEDYT